MAEAECKKCFINATLTPAGGIECQLTPREGLIGILGKAITNIPSYDGPYLVTPKFEDQTLNTNNKLMFSDVEVEAIYVSSVTNPAGGNTVYIGGIINHA